MKYYKFKLTTRLAIQWLTLNCWTHKMQSLALNLQITKVGKSYLDFGGAITLNTKQMPSITKQVILFIVRCDFLTQQLTKKLWLLPTIARWHSSNHLVLALKVEAWICEITIESPKGLNHTHWMKLLNMNFVNLKFWFSSLKPLFTMYTNWRAPCPRIQWQYTIVRSKRRWWCPHCKKWEETTIPML